MKKFLVVIGILFLPFSLQADEGNFFIQPDYDLENREQVEGKLIEDTDRLKFYVDLSWWQDLDEDQKEEHRKSFVQLGKEFNDNIYYPMTETFGPVPKHSITQTKRISVLFHPMKESAGGYFNSRDQYSKYQNPSSNERNLLYLNTQVLEYDDTGGFLAHEFMHLLTFNQKDKMRGVREEVWLNESRAEYVPTFLGYDDEYENSNLQKRVEDFERDPEISLTEWIGQKADYGVARVFTQYLVDHYGVEVLIDSLKSDKVGIPSINYALKQQGAEITFREVFDNFKIAVLRNDCQLGQEYCFSNENLKDLQISPATNYLPFTEDSRLTVSYRTKHWAGNWHKIEGGKGGQGVFSLTFDLKENLEVSLPYILCTSEGDCKVKKKRSKDGEIRIQVDDFNEKYEHITIMPSIQDKIKGFNGAEKSYLFEWTARLDREEEIQKTLEKIAELRRKLEKLKELLEKRRQEKQEEDSPETCVIEGPLQYGDGVGNSESVVCLQKFLSSRPDIYPEGYVTGNFMDLTKQAVIRFQERHKEDILEPLGLEQGTGYVGRRTISKIDNLR